MKESNSGKRPNETLGVSIAPLIVEQDRKRLIVIAFSDLDGTANDETVPEDKRLSTITPARQALQRLEGHRIFAGINTARSFGEANKYKGELGINGPVICEDGAVVALPSGIDPDHARKIGAVEHGGELAVVLSNVKKATILSIFSDAQRNCLSSSIINTLTSSPEEIKSTVGHSSLEEARLSADRLASAYFVADESERQILDAEAKKNGARTFGDLTHVIGADAHKGNALRYLDMHASLVFPYDVQGILPIAFGNGINDIPFMEACRDTNGGIGILVGRPGGGYFVDESKIPEFVIKAKSPFGHGMEETLPQVFSQLNSRFQLNLK